MLKLISRVSDAKSNVALNLYCIPEFIYGYGYGYNQIDGAIDFFDVFGLEGEDTGYFLGFDSLSEGYQYGFGYEYSQNICSVYFDDYSYVSIPSRLRRFVLHVSPLSDKIINYGYEYGYGYSQYVDGVDFFDVFDTSNGFGFGYSEYGLNTYHTYGYCYGNELIYNYKIKVYVIGQGYSDIYEGFTNGNGYFVFNVQDDCPHYDQIYFLLRSDENKNIVNMKGTSYLGEANSFLDIIVEVENVFINYSNIKCVSSAKGYDNDSITLIQLKSSNLLCKDE